MNPKAQLPAGSHFPRHGAVYSPTAATPSSPHHLMFLHSWQLRDTLGFAVHPTPAGHESLILLAAQHLRKALYTSPHSVLSAVLTNFDILQFLYKLLPCMAHSFMDHTITPSGSPLPDWRVSVSQACPTQNPLPSLNLSFFTNRPC